MDIGRAFGFVFEDEEWLNKILLGTAVMFVPILGWLALVGYAIALIRNVRAGAPRPLPAWGDLGRYFIDGLMFWIVMLVCSVPLLILICPVTLIGILPAAAGENQDLTRVLAGISGLLGVGLGCVGVLYWILLGLLAPVLQIRYAETGEIRDCLRFGEVFRFLLNNIANILVSQLLVVGAGAVIASVVSGLGAVLGAIPICGWILGLALSLLMLPVSVWLTTFSGHLYGQISRQARTAPPMV